LPEAKTAYRQLQTQIHPDKNPELGYLSSTLNNAFDELEKVMESEKSEEEKMNALIQFSIVLNEIKNSLKA
jgi:DnaJ-class molecular chaperone